MIFLLAYLHVHHLIFIRSTLNKHWTYFKQSSTINMHIPLFTRHPLFTWMTLHRCDILPASGDCTSESCSHRWARHQVKCPSVQTIRSDRLHSRSCSNSRAQIQHAINSHAELALAWFSVYIACQSLAGKISLSCNLSMVDRWPLCGYIYCPQYGSANKVTSAFQPSTVVKWVIICITGVDGRIGLRAAVWLQAIVREQGIGRRPRLYVGSASYAQRHSSCSMQLVALYERHAFCLADPKLR